MQAQAHTGNMLQQRPTHCLQRVSGRRLHHVFSNLQSAQTDLAALESACITHRAQIGYNNMGFRGLLASEHLQPGEVVISVPLHNILQVNRKLDTAHAAAAAQEALANWQHHHGDLPRELLHLITNAECPWEAKLVYWLLHLKATAAAGSLWHTYCQALPSQQETLSFFCYSEQQAELLQLSTWKALAATQRQLLHDVQQQGQLLLDSSSDSSSTCSCSAATAMQQDVIWALSMVKSRTFGRALQSQASTHHQGVAAATGIRPAIHLQGDQPVPNRFEELGSLQGAGEVDDGPDDNEVVLLMVPFVDMINHSQQNNCSFGLNWQSNCFEITSNTSITQGEELTISYGSNKTNLALLSCYGFFVPGNHNDAQLLQPIFRTCLAVTEGINGFDCSVLETAVAERMQENQAVHDDHNSKTAVQVARLQCAAAAMPVQQQLVTEQQQSPADDYSQRRSQLQLQKCLAELIVYQIQLILKLCGTSAEADAQLLQTFAAARSDSSSIDRAIEQQVTAARIEQKLLLIECRSLCQRIIRIVTAALGD